MPDYRCPTDDLVFSTITDDRKPGAPAAGDRAAHPNNGHPDCPLCQERAKNPPVKTAQTGTRRIA